MSDAENQADSRKKGFPFGIVVIIVLVLVGAVGAIVWYVSLEVVDEFTIIISTPSIRTADVYLGGEKVGSTPYVLSFEELKQHFDPALKPAVWPVPGVGGMSETRRRDYYFSMQSKAANPGQGLNENILYFREMQGKTETLLGAVTVRLETSKGEIGVLAGTGGPWTEGIIKTSNGFVKGRKRVETLQFECVKKP